VDEGGEAVGVSVELVEVGQLRGEERVVGAPGPAVDEGGLVADAVVVESDLRVEGIGLGGGGHPVLLYLGQGLEGRGGVAALGEEEGRVLLDVGADCESDEFAVEGEAEDVLGAGGGRG
jgi:hypothetical protein